MNTRAAAARREVAALDARLADTTRRFTEAEIAAAETERQRIALEIEAAERAARYRRQSQVMETSVVAAALARRGQTVRAGLLSSAAAPALAAELARTRSALAAAHGQSRALAEMSHEIAEMRQNLEAESAEATALLERQRAAQAALATPAETAQRRAQRLAAEARDLRQLAERVTAPPRRAANGAPARSGGGVVPAAWVAPAEGAIVRPYGHREAGGPAALGAAIRTRSGVEVRAPANGQVAYAGVFRSYGRVLILNLEGGYALVLTGLGTVRTEAGQTVTAGQTIGEMPSSDTSAPELYVEVRRDGQTIDPDRWLNSRGVSAERSLASAQ